MALAISPIKDASFLRVMAALQNGALLGNTPSESASTSNPSDSITAEDTGIIDLNMGPNMLRQQDEYDMQAVSDISKRFGIPSPHTGEEFSTHTDIPQNGMLTSLASTADLFTEADKQEELEANNIARRFGVPFEGFGNNMDATDSRLAQSSYDQSGKLFSVNTPSSSPAYWKTAAPIRLNQSKLDEYNTPPTKYGPDFIRAIFEANKDKNFVQRALNPTKSLDLGNGDFATHQMSYSTFNNGKARMYPEVVEKDGKLVVNLI